LGPPMRRATYRLFCGPATPFDADDIFS
jgi:hypothetical protein